MTTIDRFMARVVVAEGCWIWQGRLSSGGYGRFALAGRIERAHRAAYLLFKGPILPGFMVCHDCDNPACVRPDHLRLGSHADNMRDMRKRGRSAVGDKNGTRKHPETVARGSASSRAVLTEQMVGVARARIRSGESLRALADELGIAHGALSRAVTGVAWGHVGAAPVAPRTAGDASSLGAAEYGRRRAAVRVRLVAEIDRLRSEGLTYERIADVLGGTANSLRILRARHESRVHKAPDDAATPPADHDGTPEGIATAALTAWLRAGEAK